jgi:hypothetical protein
MKMKKLLMFIVIVMLAAACQPEPDDMKLFDELVVSTNYDPQALFANYSTFTMPTDTIGFLSNQTRDTILTHPNSGLVRPIINRIKNNMLERGYSFISRDQNPDLGINVIIVNNLNFLQQVIDPGYYYPYYYGYSSYYYPYVQTYTENTGTLVVQVVDLKNRNQNNEVRVVWSAQMGDLVSTLKQVEQTEKGIDQAFIQSTYFDKL